MGADAPPHIVLALLLTGLSANAMATYRCSDGHGREFLVAQPFGDGLAGFRCMPATEPAGVPMPERAPPSRPLLDEAVIFGSAALAVIPANRGGLVLQPLRRTGPTTAAQRATEFDAQIEAVARRYGHDANLLRAVIQVESRFNPMAVSPKGAIGLMQVMPATAASLGLADPKHALFEPEANLHTGARYLRLLLDMFSGRPDLAVAAYNAGEGAVRRYNNRVPPFPETQAYVRDVMSLYDGYRRNAR